jgi:TonB family protein
MIKSAAADFGGKIGFPVLIRVMSALTALASFPSWAQSGSSTSTIAPPQPAGGPHECRTHYPREAVLGKEEGITVLSFNIDREGRVNNVAVSQSSGYAVLDQASISCVAAWTYTPAMQNGQPAEVAWKAKIEWALPQSPVPIGSHDCRMEARQITTDRPIGIRFTVGVDGHVKDVRLSQSSGNTVFDQALIACIQTWQYQPGTKLGQPVEWGMGMPLAALVVSTNN